MATDLPTVMATAMDLLMSHGSDYELSYASPVFPDDMSPETDGRKRRTQGSSDDEYTVAADGFVNEDLRAGGPNLCPLPATIQCLGHSHPLHSQLNATHWAQVCSILTNHGVTYTDITTVEHTYHLRDNSKPVATMSITATRNHRDESWITAARAIRSYLVNCGLAHVAVEIADPRAFVLNHRSPVKQSDKIFALWEVVCDRILRTMDLTDVLAVGCFRFGKSDVATDNPPTVNLMVYVDSTRCWKDTREQIVGILNDFGLPVVAVSFRKDGFWGDFNRSS
ncbi:hypothetical protein BJX99DRAFT_263316 [Aspergillus californicus]